MAAHFDVLVRGLLDTNVFVTQAELEAAIGGSSGAGMVSMGPIDLAAKSQVLFSNIPADTNTIKLIVETALPAASSTTIVTLGIASGLTETGYVGTGANFGASTQYVGFTTSFVLGNTYSNTVSQSGNIVLERVPGTNTWVLGGKGGYSNTYTWTSDGRVVLAGQLTQIRVSRASGNFTSGSVSMRRSN